MKHEQRAAHSACECSIATLHGSCSCCECAWTTPPHLAVGVLAAAETRLEREAAGSGAWRPAPQLLRRLHDAARRRTRGVVPHLHERRRAVGTHVNAVPCNARSVARRGSSRHGGARRRSAASSTSRTTATGAATLASRAPQGGCVRRRCPAKRPASAPGRRRRQSDAPTASSPRTARSPRSARTHPPPPLSAEAASPSRRGRRVRRAAAGAYVEGLVVGEVEEEVDVCGLRGGHHVLVGAHHQAVALLALVVHLHGRLGHQPLAGARAGARDAALREGGVEARVRDVVRLQHRPGQAWLPLAARIAQLLAVGEAVPVRVQLAHRRPVHPAREEGLAEGIQRQRAPRAARMPCSARARNPVQPASRPSAQLVSSKMLLPVRAHRRTGEPLPLTHALAQAVLAAVHARRARHAQPVRQPLLELRERARLARLPRGQHHRGRRQPSPVAAVRSRPSCRRQHHLERPVAEGAGLPLRTRGADRCVQNHEAQLCLRQHLGGVHTPDASPRAPCTRSPRGMRAALRRAHPPQAQRLAWPQPGGAREAFAALTRARQAQGSAARWCAGEGACQWPGGAHAAWRTAAEKLSTSRWDASSPMRGGPRLRPRLRGSYAGPHEMPLASATRQASKHAAPGRLAASPQLRGRLTRSPAWEASRRARTPQDSSSRKRDSYIYIMM
eukprot:scaffold195_cov359-Prasinococcus_capsulatus_cf.AAC.13